MSLLTFDLEVGTKKAEILNSFCDHHGYQATVKDANGADIPNPVTKAAFAKSKIANFIRESVVAARVNKKREDAAVAEKATIDAEIIIS